MPLEMRILGTSTTLLAAQRGNTLGTCAIETLTLESVPQDLWHAFAQGVLDTWYAEAEKAGREIGEEAMEALGIKAHGTGELRVRPHWAKEWVGFKGPGGVDMKEYVREVAYKREIEEFRDVLRRIGERDAWYVLAVESVLWCLCCAGYVLTSHAPSGLLPTFRSDSRMSCLTRSSLRRRSRRVQLRSSSQHLTLSWRAVKRRRERSWDVWLSCRVLEACLEVYDVLGVMIRMGNWVVEMVFCMY